MSIWINLPEKTIKTPEENIITVDKWISIPLNNRLNEVCESTWNRVSVVLSWGIAIFDCDSFNNDGWCTHPNGAETCNIKLKN